VPTEQPTQEAKPKEPSSSRSRSKQKAAASAEWTPGPVREAGPSNLGKRGRAQLLDLVHFLPGLQQSGPITFFSDTPLHITPVSTTLDAEERNILGDEYAELLSDLGHELAPDLTPTVPTPAAPFEPGFALDQALNFMWDQQVHQPVGGKYPNQHPFGDM